MKPKLSNISEICELLTQGLDCWIKAGKILCDHLDEGSSIGKISEQTSLPKQVLEQLERVGRKQVLPQLLIADFPAAKLMERLPYSEQLRLQGEAIPCWISTNEIKNIKANDMTPRQSRQAFAAGHIRTIEEQKIWILEQRKIAPLVQVDAHYTVLKEKVVFHSACEMSRSVLLRILGELE